MHPFFIYFLLPPEIWIPDRRTSDREGRLFQIRQPMAPWTPQGAYPAADAPVSPENNNPRRPICLSFWPQMSWKSFPTHLQLFSASVPGFSSYLRFMQVCQTGTYRLLSLMPVHKRRLQSVSLSVTPFLSPVTQHLEEKLSLSCLCHKRERKKLIWLCSCSR